MHMKAIRQIDGIQIKNVFIKNRKILFFSIKIPEIIDFSTGEGMPSPYNNPNISHPVWIRQALSPTDIKILTTINSIHPLSNFSDYFQYTFSHYDMYQHLL